MEVGVPETVDVLEFEAARLAWLGRHAGALALAAALAHKPLRFHVAAHGRVRRQRAELFGARDQRFEIVVVQLVRPGRMILVLRAQRDLEPITDRLLLTGVLARAPPQPRDGIDARTSRLVVPALDRRATEARRLAGDRMTPRLRRKLGDLAVQLAACRRRREQAP